MSQVLYRKYRAKDFDHIIGQENITTILKNAIKLNKVSHAYLFVGSRGTGKTSTARVLAKALNCPHRLKDGNPCNKCEICKEIDDGKFMDIIEIDAASNRGIDQIRELKERIEYSPTKGKYKVYIIDEVHMLTKEAFNALLKTLEEPPQHVIFILATTEVHKIPATILSRCQRFDFSLGTEAEIYKLISEVAKKENLNISEEGLNTIVKHAKGSYRDALSILEVVRNIDSKEPITKDQILSVLGISDSTMVYYLLEQVVEGDVRAMLSMLDEVGKKGINIPQFVEFIIDALKGILIANITNDWDSSDFKFAQTLNRKQILTMISIMLDLEKTINVMDSPIVALETALLKIFVALHPEDNGEAPDKNDLKIEDKNGNSKTIASSNVPQKISSKVKDVIKSSVKKDADKKAQTESKRGKETLDLSIINDKWNLVIEKLKPFNGHLFAFFEKAHPTKLDNDTLILEVGFSFHKDVIEKPSNRSIVGDILEEVFGQRLAYKCEVAENLSIRKEVSPEEIFGFEPEANSSTQAVKKEDIPKKKTNFVPRVNQKIADAFEGL